MAALDVCVDNTFEWYTGDKTATATFSQKKWINKLKKLAVDYPDDVEILSGDGEFDEPPIVAHVPSSWFKFSPPKKGRVFTDEEKRAAAARLAEAREKRKELQDGKTN